jgi:hypothetical protein
MRCCGAAIVTHVTGITAWLTYTANAIVSNPGSPSHIQVGH